MCIRDRSIPADLPFFNFLTLPITSLLITSSPKYLFLLVPSNPHTFTNISSLLLILCRFSKCSFHTPLTSISSVTKAPSLFIILSRFPLFSFLTFRASFQKSFLFPCMFSFILLPNCSFTSCFLLRMHLLVFLFSSLYNYKHLSFETSSFTFSTFNQASFLPLTAFITSSFHHSLLTFFLLTLAHPHTSFALLKLLPSFAPRFVQYQLVHIQPIY